MGEDGNLVACSWQFLSIEVALSDGSGMRTLWQATELRHERVALASPDQAPVEPEHSACAGSRRRQPSRISVCTSCIRAGKVVKPPRRRPQPAGTTSS